MAHRPVASRLRLQPPHPRAWPRGAWALVLLTLLLPTGPAEGQVSLLVKQIYPSAANSSSAPSTVVDLGTTRVFQASTPDPTLWRTDGTPAGTVQVTSAVLMNSPPVLSGGVAYFVGDDGTSGNELWLTDGTEAGTRRVKDIHAGAADGLSTFAADLTDVGGTLFFIADDGSTGNEVWRSDGTDAGTQKVKEIGPGADAAAQPYIGELFVAGGTLYFPADDGSTGLELWKSDGTEAGTTVVADIGPGPEDGINVETIRVVDDTMYFTADDGVTGIEYWRSDGTLAGTLPLGDINPGLADSGSCCSVAFGSASGLVFFDALRFDLGRELWATVPGGGADSDGDGLSDASMTTATAMASRTAPRWPRAPTRSTRARRRASRCRPRPP